MLGSARSLIVLDPGLHLLLHVRYMNMSESMSERCVDVDVAPPVKKFKQSVLQFRNLESSRGHIVKMQCSFNKNVGYHSFRSCLDVV